MKIFFAVLLCKIVRLAGKLIGRGSSIPGKVVLKIFPDVLSKITLPRLVIAVSGSNGKTSTVEMLAHILSSNGMNVIWNKEGSNQIEGVATFLLNSSSLKGKVNADAVILESDERYARITFKYFSPSHFVITNLFRDQMTRNAHSEWIFDILKDAVKEKTTLVLNADDPLVSMFAKDRSDVFYFSMDKNKYSTQQPGGIYNDGKYCPVCGGELGYEYYNFAHMGKYECFQCGYKSQNAVSRVTDMDLENGTVTFDSEFKVNLAFASQYNVYNMLAAYTMAVLAGVERSKAAEALCGYALKNGRVVTFMAGKHEGMLLTSKHENSVSYNQSIDYIVRSKKPCIVMIIVDAISRKYYTCETSWLFDINFDELKNSAAQKIVLAGKYAYELAERFEFCDINEDKIYTIPQIEEACEFVESSPGNEYVFVVTCFSDKDKFLSRVKVL